MRDDKQKLKIEQLSQRKLEAESRKKQTPPFISVPSNSFLHTDYSWTGPISANAARYL